MLLVGTCYGIRSEQRLSEEVHLNLAYRWFCRLGLDGDVPDHSTFSKIGRRVLQQYRHKTDTSGWSDDVRSLGKSRGRSIARRSRLLTPNWTSSELADGAAFDERRVPGPWLS